MAIDKSWTTRAQPLTKDQFATNIDIVSIEKYATRAEASTVYGGGHSPDPAVESEPVWVVIVKGKVNVRMIGLMAAKYSDGFEADGVTYIISQRTGKVLEVAAGILQKQK